MLKTNVSGRLVSFFIRILSERCFNKDDEIKDVSLKKLSSVLRNLIHCNYKQYYKKTLSWF